MTESKETAAAASVQEEEKDEEAIVVNKMLSECPMDSVMVYSDRCEVTRTVEHDFEKPGLYEVCLEGVPASMQKESLRVTGGFGCATVLEVSTKNRFDPDADVKTLPEQINEKKELVKRLEAQSSDLAVRKEALDASERWLETWAQQIADTPPSHVEGGAKEGGVPFLSQQYIDNIRNFTEFYASEQQRLAMEDLALREEMDKVAKDLLQSREALASATRRLNASHVVVIAVVSLQVSQAGKAAFHIVYRCIGCRWSSKYDCRVDENKKVQLTYYGSVLNSTGETWKNTLLTLSTAEPAVGGEPPELRTAKVSLLPQAPKSMFSKRSEGFLEDACLECEDMCDYFVEPKSCMSVVVAEAKRGLTSCTFEIPRRTTIESDGESHNVTIAVVPDIDAKIEYLLLPRLHDAVYMKAVCSNPCDYCFLDGPCNVFVEGSFVCKSPMEYTAAGQPFSFFLGPDKDLRVTYSMPTSVSDKSGLVFKSKIENFVGMIRVKNNRDTEVKIVIQDQLPKSTSEEIKVTLVEPDIAHTPGVTIEERNLITWKKTISAGQTEVFPIKFTVEYPNGKRVEYKW